MSRVRLEERLLHAAGVSLSLDGEVGRTEGPARGLFELKDDWLCVVRTGAGPGARRDMDMDDESVDGGGRSWFSSSS